ncbi:MAG: ATP-dependent Clp protease proteolytic subunit [Desulfobacterales bacterium]|nr:ATP-dependent Clp protease proteolytic subunit [Desulfobacterales bacterium]
MSVVLLYGGLTLFFHNLWGYQLYGLLLAIGIGTVVYIPVDRYVDDKLGKLDKPNVNKPNIILGNLKEILFVIFIVSLVAVILHLAEEIRYLPWRMADEAAEQGILKPRIDWDSPLLQQRKIIITSEINEIVSQRVVSQLLFLDSIAPTESVDLYLRTVGGNTGDMFAIIETFDLIKSEVNVYAIGDCSSAGAYILAAGTGKRFCTSATIIGIHINIDDSDEEWSRQRKGKERKIDFWNKHSELPKAFYPLKGNKFYFLNATEAKRFKIIDEIITHNKGRKPGEPTDSPESGY